MRHVGRGHWFLTQLAGLADGETDPPETLETPRTARTSVVAGQVDSGQETCGVQRRLHDVGTDRIEHQLRPAKHLEGSVGARLAPREVDEAFVAPAVHGTAPDVALAVAVDDVDREIPAGLGRVTSRELRRLLSHLDTDIDVRHWRTVGSTENTTGQVETDDADTHASHSVPPIR